MIISISFSLVIYEVLTNELERFAQIQRTRIERRLNDFNSPPPELRQQFQAIPKFDPELVKETKERLVLALIFINFGIIVISGVVGYFLAGKTLKPIQEMVDEQNRFISDASHELRTPLTSLKTAMEVSLRDKNFSVQNAKTLIIESIGEVNQLQALSEHLLQLAQYQKSNNHTIFKTVFLADLVEKSIAKVTPIAKKKQITIINKTRDAKLYGSKYGLIDLLVILLDNAVKYSNKKSFVEIASQKTAKSVSISIQDKGIGIHEKDIPHIFDRFYRADSARSKNQASGYGLGLSIAKKIIDVHNGFIYVKSKINKGTTFTVQLPLK
jgi:signal transduction histidine kinase